MPRLFLRDVRLFAGADSAFDDDSNDGNYCEDDDCKGCAKDHTNHAARSQPYVAVVDIGAVYNRT